MKTPYNRNAAGSTPPFSTNKSPVSLDSQAVRAPSWAYIGPNTNISLAQTAVCGRSCAGKFSTSSTPDMEVAA